MSALFISHSSTDATLAGELKARLAAAGHRSVFLDFDPERGIPAGRHWERELYAQLRACQAMIVLCSPASLASSWCFAEITHGRALGKPLFPLQIGEGEVPALLADLQVIQLGHDREAGWQRLLDGLAAVGLDGGTPFDWDGARPPYPGLLAFERADAAVYFGRDAAVQSTIETLNRLRRLGGARLLLLLGASGSGKSSLMRAGVMPRLERDTDHWRVAPPFRPLARPLDALAVALAELPGAGPWKPLRDALAADDDSRRETAWHDLVGDLRAAAGNEVSLLLVVDQFEEALGPAGDGADADRHAAFLRLLRAMTAAPDGPVFVVATLRSDFLGAFQTHPALQGVTYEPLHLPQIALADIAPVIEGPARVAGIELEAGLAQAMAADTATDDALPLLAFTLRELVDRLGGDARQGLRLTLDQYRVQLGGLQGALARAAEALCSDAEKFGDALAPLRRALLKLVRIDGEGRFVRQPAAWQDLPAEAQPLLERFVQARLLVSRSDDDGERVLEVAHEALFRSWDRLAGWLAADREFLLWRARQRSAVDDWQRNGCDASLLLRGPVLAEARRWQAERGDDLDAPTCEFIAAGLALRDAEQAARDRRRRRTTGALVSALMVFAVLAAAALWQWQQADSQRLRADAQRQLALARQLIAQADVAQPKDPVLGLLLTAQSLRSAWTADGHGALTRRIDSLVKPQASAWQPHPGAVMAMAWSRDGRWLATAGQGRLQIQSVAGELRELAWHNGRDYLHTLAFSPQGEWLAAACTPQTVCLYDTASWQLALRLAVLPAPVSALSFSADGRLLAVSALDSAAVRLFALPSGEPLQPIVTRADHVSTIALSADGRHLALATVNAIEVWQVATRRRVGLHQGDRGSALAFSPDGSLLVVAGEGAPRFYGLLSDGGGELRLSPRSIAAAPARTGPFGRIGFSDDGRWLAFSDRLDGVHLIELPSFEPPAALLAPGGAGALAFGSGRQLLAGGIDGRIRAWDPDDKPQRRLLADAALHAVALDAGGRRLATAGAGDRLRLVDLGSGDGPARELLSLKLASDPGGLGFSADGRWLAVVDGKLLRLVDTGSARVVGPFRHEGLVTGVGFEPGGQRLATRTAWDAVTGSRHGIKRPTRIRVWDIDQVAELGWRFDIAGDLLRASSVAAKASLAGVGISEGGDAALAAAAPGWPLAFAGDDLRHHAELRAPAQDWLQARLSDGTPLWRVALRRAGAADGTDDFGDDTGRFAFSGDGRLLASIAGREARLWPLTADDLLADACQRLPRNLSCREWREALADLPYARTCPRLPDPPGAPSCQAAAAR